MRVTDLIFKLQSGTAPDAPAPATLHSSRGRHPIEETAGDAPPATPPRRAVAAPSDPIIGPNGEWITNTDPR